MIYHREKVCDDEHILTKNLSVCKKTDGKCEYLHFYGNVRYCQKFKRTQDESQWFRKNPDNLGDKVV